MKCVDCLTQALASLLIAPITPEQSREPVAGAPLPRVEREVGEESLGLSANNLPSAPPGEQVRKPPSSCSERRPILIAYLNQLNFGEARSCGLKRQTIPRAAFSRYLSPSVADDNSTHLGNHSEFKRTSRRVKRRFHGTRRITNALIDGGGRHEELAV